MTEGQMAEDLEPRIDMLLARIREQREGDVLMPLWHELVAMGAPAVPHLIALLDSPDAVIRAANRAGLDPTKSKHSCPPEMLHQFSVFRSKFFDDVVKRWLSQGAQNLEPVRLQKTRHMLELECRILCCTGTEGPLHHSRIPQFGGRFRASPGPGQRQRLTAELGGASLRAPAKSFLDRLADGRRQFGRGCGEHHREQ